MRFRLVTTLCLSTAAIPAAAQGPGSGADWVAGSALYEIFVRDFSATGDLAGVTRGLDRVVRAGANVVWLMPIHPVGVEGRKEPLGSPYAVRDHRAIHPDFGTAADFRALVAAAHRRGLKVILDWVPNHTARDHVWIGAHPEFYVRDDQGKPSVPRDPDGKLTDWTDVAQLDYGNPALRREMIATLQWWLTEFGIDGYRFDVAGFVPAAFWREALPALRRSVDRPLLLLAEWGDPAMHDLGFDLTYSWDGYRMLKAVWKGTSADSLVRFELADRSRITQGAGRLRFTTNHDETAWDSPPITLFGGSAGARAAFVAAALLPGRPLLYAGQEVESPQKLGLFTREAVVWNQPGAAAARAHYRRVLELARTDPAFLAGPLAAVRTSAPDDVISYRRGDALVLVNARPRPVRLTIEGEDVAGVRDLLTGRLQANGAVTLPAYGALVLARRPAGGRTAR